MYGSRAESVGGFRSLQALDRRPALGVVMRARASAQRVAELTARSRRAGDAASLKIAAATGQLTIYRALPRRQGRHWYRFIRMRGGSQIHQLVPAVFTFSGRLVKDARCVSVVGPFNQWNPTVHRLTRAPDGDWTITIYLPPGRIIYHFDVDGTYWLDPVDEGRVPNAWGTQYSVRTLTPTTSRLLADPTRLGLPIRGGAHVDEPASQTAPRRTAAVAAGAEEADAFPWPPSAELGSLSEGGGPQLDCYLEQRFEVAILHVRGEVDLATASQFEIALQKALATGQSVVVSLRETPYLDSAGLYVLSRARSHLVTRGQRLVLAEPSRSVGRVFEVVRLEETLPIFSSVEAALHYLIGKAQDKLRSP